MVIAVISAVPLWPIRDGGRRRTAALVSELSRVGDVVVIQPETTLSQPDGVEAVRVETFSRREINSIDKAMLLAGSVPKVGAAFIGRHQLREISDAVAGCGADIVVSAHSYVGAMVGPVLNPRIRHVVDFPNIESRRWAAIANARNVRLKRLVARREAQKAVRWERALARSASAVVATTSVDAQYLSQFAQQVLVVPNAADFAPGGDSERDGPVTYLANARYEPNVRAGRWFVEAVWPAVAARVSGARLRIAGFDTDEVFAWARDAHRGIDVIGAIESPEETLHESSLVVAPAGEGGGSQLKVVEALSSGRVVIGKAFGRAAVPEHLGFAYISVDTAEEMAEAIIQGLVDLEWRRGIERRLRERNGELSWAGRCHDLLAFVERQAAGL